MHLAHRLDRFSEYIFARLAKESALVTKKTGRKVLSFGAGTPDIPPSKVYVQKYAEFLAEPTAHLYPGYTAIPELSDALVTWYKQRFAAEITSSEILPLLGGKDGIMHAPLALTDEGDEILTPNPGYPAFTGAALLYGAKPVYYDLTEEDRYEPQIDQLEKLLTKKTRFMWINYPSNPTGACITKIKLEKLITFAKKHNLWIIYDNAYSEITFDGYVAPSILTIPGAKDVAIEIGSFSKTFSFAGYRMGWLVGNEQLIQAITKVKSQIDSGMSLPLQKLGAYALTNTDRQWHDQMLHSYQSRRDMIASYLKKIGLRFELPKGSLYIWAKIPDSAKDSESYCLEMLHNHQILFTPGSAFGSNGNRYIRVSICVNIDTIEQYFAPII